MTISELLDSVLPRLNDKPQCSIIEAVRKAQTVIVNRLMLKRSKLLKDRVTVSVASGDDYIPVPNDGGRVFLAVAGTPKIGTYPLAPYDEAMALSETGKPRYYERTGRKFNLYPTADAAYDITIPVFMAPVVPSSLSDELPFDGLLDEVFTEAAFGVMLNGTSAVSDRAFTAVIDSQVDQVLLSTEMADEQAFVDSINYRG